jgi:hypothetical protein
MPRQEAAMSEYDTDILRWSEHQADALRRRAANEIDWENVAEEIESVGNEQRHAVESLLTNILQHRLQIMTWPMATAVFHWQHEIDGWRVQLRKRFRRAPKLRADIIAAGVAELYQDAIQSMYREVDGVPRPPMPEVCPFTLDELLAD